MKNLKYLVVFLAGVAFTLLFTGNVPQFPGLAFPRVPIADEFLGVLGVFALIILAAFIASNRAGGNAGKFGRGFQFLRDFRTSKTDCWLGGICGALGQRTPIPSWVWRLGFAVTFLYYGSGLLAYFLLWIFVPSDDGVIAENAEAEAPKPESFPGFLRLLKRSDKDYWFGGVCGGLAEKTSVPAWVWRLGFAALIFFYGSGLLVYLLMWVFVPRRDVKNPLAT